MYRRAEVAPRAVRELESPTAYKGFFFFPRVILKLCPEGHKKSKEGCAKGFCRGARAVPGRAPEKIPTFSRGFLFASRSASGGSAHVASRRLFLPAAEEVTEFQGSGKSKIFLWGIVRGEACGLSGGGSPARRGAGDARRGGHLYLYLEFSSACGCCPARAAGRLPGAGHGVRGGDPSTPPAPPYSPFCGNAKAVSLMGQYLARRVSRGASARTFPALPGDVRACCGAPSALRASGIAFAPAPSLRRRRGRGDGPYQATRGGGPAAEMRPCGSCSGKSGG